jgi:hypothetical protein
MGSVCMSVSIWTGRLLIRIKERKMYIQLLISFLILNAGLKMAWLCQLLTLKPSQVVHFNLVKIKCQGQDWPPVLPTYQHSSRMENTEQSASTHRPSNCSFVLVTLALPSNLPCTQSNHSPESQGISILHSHFYNSLLIVHSGPWFFPVSSIIVLTCTFPLIEIVDSLHLYFFTFIIMYLAASQSHT